MPAVLTRFAGGGAELVASSDSVLELDCLVLLLEAENRDELAEELDVLLDALDEAEEVLGASAGSTARSLSTGSAGKADNTAYSER